MPEHFHILLWPSDLANPSQIIQRLEERVAKFVLSSLRTHVHFPWITCYGSQTSQNDVCATPVHDQAHYRVWQRRF